MINFVTSYLNFVRFLMGDGVELKNISQLESFQTFRKQNLINFEQAARVDKELFGHSGGYWTSAFGYPQEGQDVYRNTNEERTYVGKAVNVGLLTFDIDY